MKTLASFLAAGLAVMATVAAWGWMKAGRMEQRALAAETSLNETETLRGEAADRVRELEKEAEQLGRDAREVHRLRGEVSRLSDTESGMEKVRGENRRLQSENRALRQQRNAAVIGNAGGAPRMPAGHFPRENWEFLGYGTPEDALVSAIWTMQQGDPQAYLMSLSPEEQDRMRQRWQDRTEKEIVEKHLSDVEFISGIRVLDSQVIDQDRILMDVYIQGEASRMQKVVMQRIDGQWKYGGEAGE